MHYYASFTALLAATSALSSIVQVSSFIVHPTSSHSHRAVTHLNLENHIAEMIDNELDRLQNYSEWKRKQDEKRNKGRDEVLPSNFDFNSAISDFQPNAAQKIQLRKDKRMARDDPARYCADRCVATGNC